MYRYEYPKYARTDKFSEYFISHGSIAPCSLTESVNIMYYMIITNYIKFMIYVLNAAVLTVATLPLPL